MPALNKSTALDYRLPQTVEYIQQGWLNSCQNSAVTSGLLTIVGTILLFFAGAADGVEVMDSNAIIALKTIGYATIFLNISACLSCFILLDRLGEIPYRASRNSNIPSGGKTSLEQEGILKIYGVGALWKWVVWHWLFCFITGAWGIFAQLLIHIWLQESKQTRIALSCIGVFCVLPLFCFLLAPVINRFKANKKGDMESFSNIESLPGRSPATPTVQGPWTPPPFAVRVGTPDPRERVRSMASSYRPTM